MVHPGNGSAEWLKDLQGQREAAWWDGGACIWSGGEKMAEAWKGGSPFCAETKGSERERGCKSQDSVGTKGKPLQNIDGGMRNTESDSFYFANSLRS